MTHKLRLIGALYLFRYISAVTLPRLWSRLELKVASSSTNYKKTQKYLTQFRGFLTSIVINGLDNDKMFITKPSKSNPVQNFFSVLNLIVKNMQKSDKPLHEFRLSDFGEEKKRKILKKN